MPQTRSNASIPHTPKREGETETRTIETERAVAKYKIHIEVTTKQTTMRWVILHSQLHWQLRLDSDKWYQITWNASLPSLKSMSMTQISAIVAHLGGSLAHTECSPCVENKIFGECRKDPCLNLGSSCTSCFYKGNDAACCFSSKHHHIILAACPLFM